MKQRRNVIKAVLAVASARSVVADGYGSGLSKNTFAASDPLACYAFFATYLPVRCQDHFACNVSEPCLTAGRVALCAGDAMISDSKCSMPLFDGPGGGPGPGAHGEGSPGGGGGAGDGPGWLASLGKGPSGPPQGGPPGGDNEGGGPPGGPNGGPPSWTDFFSGMVGGGGPPMGPGGGPGGGGGGPGTFGIHTVNTTARPGHSEVLAAEFAFQARFAHAVATNTYDPFLDFATVLHASDLSSYIKRFIRDGVPFLLVRWSAGDDDSVEGGSSSSSSSSSPSTSNSGGGGEEEEKKEEEEEEEGKEGEEGAGKALASKAPYYSLLVRACGQVIFELVSAKDPSAVVAPADSTSSTSSTSTSTEASVLTALEVAALPAFIDDPLARLPRSAFEDNDVQNQDPRILTPLAVSKGVTAGTLVAVDVFYTRSLLATTAHHHATTDIGAHPSQVSCYRLSGAKALVRFVSRPPLAILKTATPSTVATATAAASIAAATEKPKDQPAVNSKANTTTAAASTGTIAQGSGDGSRGPTNPKTTHVPSPLPTLEPSPHPWPLPSARPTKLPAKLLPAYAPSAQPSTHVPVAKTTFDPTSQLSGSENETADEKGVGNEVEKQGGMDVGETKKETQDQAGEADGLEVGETKEGAATNERRLVSGDTGDSEASGDYGADAAAAGSGDGWVLGVGELEELKHSVRGAYRQDEFCGVDQFMDNHFAWDQFSIDLNVLTQSFDEHKIPYHVFGDGSAMGPGQGKGGAPTNVYVTDPTGDSIQIDGLWSAVPKGGSDDSLMDACSQGNCCGKGRIARSATLAATTAASSSPSSSFLEAATTTTVAEEEEGVAEAVRASVNCSRAMAKVMGLKRGPPCADAAYSSHPTHVTTETDDDDEHGSGNGSSGDGGGGGGSSSSSLGTVLVVPRAFLAASSCEPADLYMYCALGGGGSGSEEEDEEDGDEDGGARKRGTTSALSSSFQCAAPSLLEVVVERVKHEIQQHFETAVGASGGGGGQRSKAVYAAVLALLALLLVVCVLRCALCWVRSCCVDAWTFCSWRFCPAKPVAHRGGLYYSGEGGGDFGDDDDDDDVGTGWGAGEDDDQGIEFETMRSSGGGSSGGGSKFAAVVASAIGSAVVGGQVALGAGGEGGAYAPVGNLNDDEGEEGGSYVSGVFDGDSGGGDDEEDIGSFLDGHSSFLDQNSTTL